MNAPDTRTPVISPGDGAGTGRRGSWLRYPLAAVAVVVLWLAYDTLQNSGGDIRELWLSYRIERYIGAHPALSASDKADLRAGRVVRGWNREMCRVAWGDPERVLNIGNLGTEIWHYGGNIESSTLVFTEGVLTDFGP
jgi:hypothetical protein